MTGHGSRERKRQTFNTPANGEQGKQAGRGGAGRAIPDTPQIHSEVGRLADPPLVPPGAIQVGFS